MGTMIVAGTAVGPRRRRRYRENGRVREDEGDGMILMMMKKWTVDDG